MDKNKVSAWVKKMAAMLDYYGGNGNYMDYGIDGYSDDAREVPSMPSQEK